MEHLADPVGVAENHRGAEVVPSDLRRADQHPRRRPSSPDAGFQKRFHRLGKIAAAAVHFGFSRGQLANPYWRATASWAADSATRGTLNLTFQAGEGLACREHVREEPITELTLLTVPACPNAAAFEERLAAALAGRPGVVVHRREIRDESAAAQAGMLGSPTLLINGVDPFALPGQAPSLSCRLYRDAAGRLAPAPSAEALRQALAAADDD